MKTNRYLMFKFEFRFVGIIKPTKRNYMNISLSMRRFNNQTKIFKYPRYNGNDQKVSRTQIVHNITNITTNSHCRYNSAGPREQSVIRLAAEEDDAPKMPLHPLHWRRSRHPPPQPGCTGHKTATASS